MTTQTNYQQQAQSFLDKFGIKFRATLSDTKVAPWRADDEAQGVHKSGHHFRVTLSKARPAYRLYEEIAKGQTYRIVFDFWSSIADAEAGIKTVTPYDVLACISSDTSCPETFKDFCGEFGYEADSIKALQTFRRCSAFAKRLREFFTQEEIEALQEIQ